MVCDHCGSTHVSQCVKCKDVFYCSRECQVAAWSAHKTTCKATVAAARLKADAYMAVAAHMGLRHMPERDKILQRESELHEELTRLDTAAESTGIVKIADEVIDALEALVAENAPLGVQFDTRFPRRGVFTYSILGKAYTSTHDYRAAMKMFEKARGFFFELNILHPDVESGMYQIDDAIYQIEVFTLYANALLKCGMASPALHVFRDMLFVAEHTTNLDKACLLAVINNLAAGQCEVLDYALAEKTLLHSLNIAHEHEHEEHAMLTLKCLGTVKLRVKDHTAAYTFYSRSRDFAQRLGNMALEAELSVFMAECCWTKACLAAPINSPVQYHGVFYEEGWDGALTEMTDILGHVRQLAAQQGERGVVEADTQLCIFLLYAFSRSVEERDVFEHMSCMLLTYQNSMSCVTCSQCGQLQTTEHPLRICRICRLARFCNKECQRKFSSSSFGGACHMPHKMICPMLRAFRKTITNDVDAEDATRRETYSAALLMCRGNTREALKLRTAIQEFIYNIMQKTRAFAAMHALRD